MVSLLLVCFVMLYSMSVIDPEKYQGLKESMSEIIQDKTPPVSQEEEKKLEAILDKLIEYIQKEKLDSQVIVQKDIRELNIDLASNLLFDPASTSLKPSAMAVLKQISHFLTATDGRLTVEGHTDNQPISNAQFPSNWELSTARAASVLHFLVENGLNEQTAHLVGYGETKPVLDNDTPEHQAQNRRVRLIFQPIPETELPPIEETTLKGNTLTVSRTYSPSMNIQEVMFQVTTIPEEPFYLEQRTPGFWSQHIYLSRTLRQKPVKVILQMKTKEGVVIMESVPTINAQREN